MQKRSHTLKWPVYYQWELRTANFVFPIAEFLLHVERQEELRKREDPKRSSSKLLYCTAVTLFYIFNLIHKLI